MSKQWNPLRDLVVLQDRMNRLFEDTTERRARVSPEEGDAIETADWYPAADVYDREGAYLIAVDLPGIDRTTLDISLDDNRLTIRGARAVETVATVRSERPGGEIPAYVQRAHAH